MKKNSFFSKQKKRLLIILIVNLQCLTPDLDLSLFLENFVLIWDLFHFPEHEFLQLQKQIKHIPDLGIIQAALEDK